jgi:hypothetical protein
MDEVFANAALIPLGASQEKVTITGDAPAGTPVGVEREPLDRGELTATPVPALPAAAPAKSYRVLIGREGRMKQAGATVKTWTAACVEHRANLTGSRRRSTGSSATARASPTGAAATSLSDRSRA